MLFERRVQTVHCTFCRHERQPWCPPPLSTSNSHQTSSDLALGLPSIFGGWPSATWKLACFPQRPLLFPACGTPSDHRLYLPCEAPRALGLQAESRTCFLRSARENSRAHVPLNLFRSFANQTAPPKVPSSSLTTSIGPLEMRCKTNRTNRMLAFHTLPASGGEES